MKKIPTAIAGFVGLLMLTTTGMAIGNGSGPAATNCEGGQMSGPPDGGLRLADSILQPEQLQIAGIIISKAAQLSRTARLSESETLKAEVIGVAVAFGESSLRNPDYGDGAGPDSRGAFQQRVPWGTLAQRMDPAEAATLFYTVNKGPGVRGLFNTVGWQQMTVAQAAHVVQGNADPNHYVRFEPLAIKLVTQANGGRAVLAPPECKQFVPSGNLQIPPNIGKPGIFGYYTMPPSLDGSILPYSCAANRTGSLELISVIYSVAKQWKARYPMGYIHLGDLNASGHKSHKWGVGVDLEATTNGTDWVADFTKVGYNKNATIELGKLFLDTGKVKNIWYMDQSVDDALVAYAVAKNLPSPNIKSLPGHDNHFHLDTTTTPGPIYEPSC